VAVPNVRFVFASVPNSGPNSLFVFGQIMKQDRIGIVQSCASHRIHAISGWECFIFW